MTYKELLNNGDPYAVESAVPSGKITNRDQYKYMITFAAQTGMDFYFTDDDRHYPSYQECLGRYLKMISFFGGASFFFTIMDKPDQYSNDWTYGQFGKIEFEI